jgi:hypothetical protein
MAAAALREFSMNAFCVRQIMTVAASRHSFMLIGMAGDASDITVLGCGGHQLIKRNVMTSGTKIIRGAVRVVQNQRLVNFVAGSAVILGHAFRVRLVTDGTFRDVTVSVCVAEVTGNIGVFAGVGDQLLILTGMTGQTFGFQITFENHAQRLMRIVTAQAVIKGIVVRTIMTHAALRDVCRAAGAVAGVTFLAVDLLLVSGASFVDFSRLQLMTFCTVIYAQYGLRKSGIGCQ